MLNMVPTVKVTNYTQLMDVVKFIYERYGLPHSSRGIYIPSMVRNVDFGDLHDVAEYLDYPVYVLDVFGESSDTINICRSAPPEPEDVLNYEDWQDLFN